MFFFRDVRLAFVVGNGACPSGVGDRKRTCGGEREKKIYYVAITHIRGNRM